MITTFLASFLPASNNLSASWIPAWMFVPPSAVKPLITANKSLLEVVNAWDCFIPLPYSTIPILTFPSWPSKSFTNDVALVFNAVSLWSASGILFWLPSASYFILFEPSSTKIISTLPIVVVCSLYELALIVNVTFASLPRSGLFASKLSATFVVSLLKIILPESSVAEIFIAKLKIPSTRSISETIFDLMFFFISFPPRFFSRHNYP